MPATEQQFGLISSLPGVQAAILAGVASEAARLRSGLLEWRKLGRRVPFDEEVVNVFCRNAGSIVISINRLEWMKSNAPISSYW